MFSDIHANWLPSVLSSEQPGEQGSFKKTLVVVEGLEMECFSDINQEDAVHGTVLSALKYYR